MGRSIKPVFESHADLIIGGVRGPAGRTGLLEDPEFPMTGEGPQSRQLPVLTTLNNSSASVPPSDFRIIAIHLEK